MEYFRVKNGKIIEMTKKEFENQKATSVKEVVMTMTPEEKIAFQKERYEKFIKPLITHNTLQINKLKVGHKLR